MAIDDSPLTRASLLLRIRDSEDQVSWGEFVELYVPLIYGFARNQGLQDADAADVAQDVMTSVNSAISGFDYDAQQGRFRGYLYTVTRNQIGRFWKKNVGKVGTGNTAVHALLNQTEARNTDEEEWNEQHRWRLFEWARQKVQPEFTENTWQAFKRTSLDHHKPQEVAHALGISVGAVYIAKSRVIKRIRDVVAELEQE